MGFESATACSELAACLVSDSTSIGELAYQQLLTIFAHTHPLANSSRTFSPNALFNQLELAFSLRGPEQRSRQIMVALRDTAIADTETTLAALVNAELLQPTTTDIPAFLRTLQRATATTTDLASEVITDLTTTYHFIRDHLPPESLYCTPLATIEALLHHNVFTVCQQYKNQVVAYAIHLRLNVQDKSPEELVRAITDWYTEKFAAATSSLNTLEVISALANLKVSSVAPLAPDMPTSIDLTTIASYPTTRNTETTLLTLPTTLFDINTPRNPGVAELHRELQRAAEAAGEYVFKQLETQAVVIASTHDTSMARPYYSIILSWMIYRLHNETVCAWHEINQLYILIHSDNFTAKEPAKIKTELQGKFQQLLNSINQLISYINIAHTAIQTSGNESEQTLELLSKLHKFTEFLNDHYSKICSTLSKHGIDIDPSTTKPPFTDIAGFINARYKSHITRSPSRRRLSSGARPVLPMLGSPPGSPTSGSMPPDPFRMKAAIRAGAVLGHSTLFVTADDSKPVVTTRDASTQTPAPSTEYG